MRPAIYLDNGATSWPKPECVYQAVDQTLRKGGSAGRGSHLLSLGAGRVLMQARQGLAKLFNIKQMQQIVFMLNATDALNTALFGLLKAGDIVVTTAMEHNSVVRPLCQLDKRGVLVRVARCTNRGTLDMDDLAIKLVGAKLLVLSHASNVTGQIVPLAQISNLAHDNHCLVLVDAAQTAGVYPIDTNELGIDLLAFSGHKGLLGPQGTGGLYVATTVPIEPMRFGGTGSLSESAEQPSIYPDRLESGTQNTPGIAGLAAGVEYILQQGVHKIRRREQLLRRKLWEGLANIPGVKLWGEELAEHTANLSFTIADRDCSEISYLLETEHKIICRAGLQCSPLAHQALGSLQTGTVRFSPGFFTEEKEIEAAIKAVGSISREVH